MAEITKSNSVNESHGEAVTNNNGFAKDFGFASTFKSSLLFGLGNANILITYNIL